MTAPQVQVPQGLVCVTTFGFLRHEMVQSWMDLRSHNDAQGLKNVKYVTLPGTLVEKARNEAVRQMLRENMGWLCFIDGDMTFPPDALLKLLATAYGSHPFVDAIGAWCPLRGELSLPTTDYGSGTWESSFPGAGVREVIRTGAAFLLVKRHVFEALEDPWFRMRVPKRPIDAMLEVDNFARCRLNGENPFRRLPEWEQLEKAAKDDPSALPENFVPVEVGEDSGFADRMRAAGFRLFVHHDVACGHVDSVVRTWADHAKAMRESEKWPRLASGLLS
jgi:hypothetical protein